MSSTMEYKGYIGSVEFSETDGVFFGKVLGIRSLISYEGTNASELISDFHGAVDDYLAECEEDGIKPETPKSGKLIVRMTPEMHSKAAETAARQGISLNEFISRAIAAAL